MDDGTHSLLGELAGLIGALTPRDAVTRTAIPFVSLLRSSRPTAMNLGLLDPSACLVVQGGKSVLIGRKIVHYGPGNYIVSVLDVPTAGQVSEASPKRPYLSVKIGLDVNEIAAVFIESGIQPRREDDASPCVHVGAVGHELLDAILRLVRLLDGARSRDTTFLARNIKREIIYHLLATEQGGGMYQKSLSGFRESGIGRTVEWIRANYAQPFRVEDLARDAGMSVSSFHQKFKGIMTLGPLRYQKQLRLLEARRLLLQGGIDAAGAGFSVGYASPTQFSREYRRFFGSPPIRDMVRLRSDALANGATQEFPDMA